MANLVIGRLKKATQLQLTSIPATASANSLVDDLANRVATLEAALGARMRGRRQIGQEKQRRAVGAIVSGLLERWGHPVPQVVFRSRHRASFSAGLIGYRQYVSALDALISLGLVGRAPGIKFGTGIAFDGLEQFTRLAERLWPLQPLLDLAAEHGVVPATIKYDFEHVHPTKAPAVSSPVHLFALKKHRRGHRIPLRIARDDPDASRLRAQVEAYNGWVAEHDVRGCVPPRFKRVFTASWDYGGRWYAVGSEGVYQRMSKEERLSVTINGERVIEADVPASQLSIMHGLLGLELPDGDPYTIADIPRSVVKHWVVATLGKGSRVERWATVARERELELTAYDARIVGATICERYPFLRDPIDAVAKPAGLDKLADMGQQRMLLAHRLMAIEAQVITGAMDYLRSTRDALALPIHDGLIVPESARDAVGEALVGAYGALAKVRVKWTVSPE